MSRHLDSGYAQPHMNEHESQREAMLEEGINSVRPAIVEHLRSEAKKLNAQADKIESATDAPEPGMNTSAPAVEPTKDNPLVESYE